MSIKKRQPRPGPERVRWTHLALLQDPSRWPMYPFLPLRNDQMPVAGMPRCGILYDAQGQSGKDDLQTTVFLVNLLDIGDTIKGEVGFLQQQHLSYQSFEEILAAGWWPD